MRRKKYFFSQMGFTLVELLVALAIAGIISVAMTRLFITSNEIYVTQEQIVRLHQDIRATFDMISRNIRMAGLDPSGKADNAGIMNANAATIRILYDYNANGTCDRDFDYRLQGQSLTVQMGGAGGYQQLADNITSLQFSYTLTNGTVTTAPADPSSIRLVNTLLCGRITGAFAGKYNNNYCLSSSIRCRNLGIY